MRKAREGEGTRGGLFPSREGGGWGTSPEKIFKFLLLCAFLSGFFMRFEPDFSRFGHKDNFCLVSNRMLDKIVFRQSHGVFF